MNETVNGLNGATHVALDGMLRALKIERHGDDHFVGPADLDRFGRTFGGQTLAQALVAAAMTVAAKDPHSVHAAHVEAGVPGQPVELSVVRVRDGRSMSIRTVTVTQSSRTLLVATVSFHVNPSEPQLNVEAPMTSKPEALPLIQQWAVNAPQALQEHARHWVDTPPPLELRIGEAPYFLGGTKAVGPRTHWMRLPRSVGDDAVLQSALLAYASDYLLLDMAFRSYPKPVDTASVTAFSVDHAIWIHRPFRFHDWHEYTQELVALSGHRGLVRGAIYDQVGQLVASVYQEVLIR